MLENGEFDDLSNFNFYPQKNIYYFELRASVLRTKIGLRGLRKKSEVTSETTSPRPIDKMMVGLLNFTLLREN